MITKHVAKTLVFLVCVGMKTLSFARAIPSPPDLPTEKLSIETTAVKEESSTANFLTASRFLNFTLCILLVLAWLIICQFFDDYSDLKALAARAALIDSIAEEKNLDALEIVKAAVGDSKERGTVDS